jgi:hypothetical protein
MSFCSLGTTILDNDINVHILIKKLALYGKKSVHTHPKIIFKINVIPTPTLPYMAMKITIKF